MSTLLRCLRLATVLPSRCPSRTCPSAARRLSTSRAATSTFEPDYLDSGGVRPEAYPLLNIQLKGYDFHILESYQSYVHHLCENMGIDVTESWATPCQDLEAKIFHVGGTVVKEGYSIKIYERNVQMSQLRSVDAPLLLDALVKTLPEGVSMSVHENLEEHVEAKYIPDPFVEGLKKELGEIEQKSVEEREEKATKRAAKDAAKTSALLASLKEEEE